MLPVAVCWSLWKESNDRIFEDEFASASRVSQRFFDVFYTNSIVVFLNHERSP